MDFKGKNVIYIGGFGGIGQKCVEELLKKNVKNLIIFESAQNDAYLKTLQETYPFSNVYYILVDMAKRESIDNAYNRAMDTIGHIDVVVNGSGVLDERQIDLTVNVNLTGVIHSCMIALNYMNKSKGGQGGVIVNISSVAGFDPISITSVYTATKFGVTGFTRSIAHPRLYEKTGVSFITICPGRTSTPLVVDMRPKTTFPEYAGLLKVPDGKYPIQTPEEFSKTFIQVLEQAENGTVWALENGKFGKIEFPALWSN